MDNLSFDNKKLNDKEIIIQIQTESFYGKDLNGFCDFSMKSIELLTNLINVIEVNNVTEYSDIIEAHRFLSYLHYKRVCFSFRSCYLLFLKGYYFDASIILRSIMETFVRMKYIKTNGSTKDVLKILSGHTGYKNEKYEKSHYTHFETISKGLYKNYKLLCDISHGSLCPHLLLTDVNATISELCFQQLNSTFISNQLSALLLAHLEYFDKVFPESLVSIDFIETKQKLWKVMKEISSKEQNKEWHDEIKTMIEY